MSIRIDRAALKRLLEGQETKAVLKKAATKVRDEARTNAGAIDSNGNRAQAIVADDPAVDAEGLHVDVGYDKTDPGFDLWWSEVGTVDQPARPHLRPALRPGLLD